MEGRKEGGKVSQEHRKRGCAMHGGSEWEIDEIIKRSRERERYESYE